MASNPSSTPDVELHEPESAKPQPLRIVKRSQTATDCPATRKAVVGGRGSSGTSDSSKGSPPLGLDRPLTVRKKRQGRSSFLTGSLDDTEWDIAAESPLTEMVKRQRERSERNEVQDDPDITPKANRGVPRTISAGAFLKSELHQRSSDIEAGRYSVRGPRHSILPQDQRLENFRASSPKKSSPAIPERRPSKSKNFLLRALGGRNHAEPKSVRLVDSAASKNTLVRRLSKSRKSSSNSTQLYHTDTSFSTSSELFCPDSSDIADVDIKSRTSSFGDNELTPSHKSSLTATSSTNFEDNYVLTPQITITPEISSVDTASCYLWVALEIRGILRRAESEHTDPPNRLTSDSSTGPRSDLRRYGRLHSMHITLDLGPSCMLSDLVGDLQESNVLRAGETHLILAKIHFSTTKPRSHVCEASADDLIDELQQDLGHSLTRYITVRLNYKHSGFSFYKTMDLNSEGTTSHTTRLFTEASAAIRRHNSQSAWSPRTSLAVNRQSLQNPILPLIENILPAEEARYAIQKMMEDYPMPMPRRYGDPGGSSEDTLRPVDHLARVESTIATALISPATTAPPAGPFTRIPSAHLPGTKEGDDIDPARQIWSEMRRNSRGGRRNHARMSISADHYYSLDEQGPTPSRISSSETSMDSVHTAKTDIDKERDRIMEVALRNKRSVGAETLRSIAPSVANSTGRERPKGAATMNGLGLNGARTWWAPSWW